MKLLVICLIFIILIILLFALNLKSNQEKYQFDNLKDVKYLLGPVSGSFHHYPSSKGAFPQKIFIFGDIHIPKQKCPSEKESNKNSIKMIDFLIELSKSSSETLDYYLESSAKEKYPQDIISGLQKRNLPIDEVILRFLDCLSSKKEDCEFKNTRFHYTDFRHINEDLNILILFRILLTRNPENLNINWQDIKNIFANPERIFRDTKIDKQIENIKIPVVKQIALKVKEKIIGQFVELFMATDVIEAIILHKLYLTFNENPQLYQVFIRYNNLIMESTSEMLDLYLFSRMFREFKDGSTSKNSIIYLGEAHAERLRMYLTALGFTQEVLVKSDKEDDFACLDITSLKPFLSF